MTGLTLPQKLLLRDVAAGDVWRYIELRATYDVNGRTGKRCSARMLELAAAGWVVLNGRQWQLTDAGHAVLDAHRSQP